MKCVNCGAVMSEGQKICSICDTDNSNYIYDNTPSYNNEPIVYKTNTYEEEKKIDDISNDDDNSSSHSGKLFSIIVIILIFVILVLGLKYFLNYKNIKTEDNNTENNEIFELYKKIENDVNVKMLLGEEIVCYDNCMDYYDYDSDKYTLYIDDYEDYYEISLTDNIGLIDTSLCNKDIKCTDSNITGKIIK